MLDLELAQRVLYAFGPARIAVIGELSDDMRKTFCDSGAQISAGSDLSPGTYILLLDCDEQTTRDVITRASKANIAGIYLSQRRSGSGFSSLEQLEEFCFALDLRKHPCYYRVFQYADLEHAGEFIETVLEPIPDAAAVRFPMVALKAERDLHMDMLREAGRRSDAHVARYQWASSFIRPNDVVLDAACGLGYGTYVMREVSRGSRFVGVDGSGWAIDYAQACFGEQDVEYKQGMLPEALQEFPDNSVDLIVSFETLEHVEDPAGLIHEFQRILRPAGRIVVSVPNDWSDETGDDPNPHHLHVYTWERLAQELRERGPFVIEGATRQIASACKRLDVACQWIDRPRTLESVPIQEAGKREAEWWLAVAMKDPLEGDSVPYIETVHGRFEGKTHLCDFAEHYENAWLLHGMVEIPFRMQDAEMRAVMAHRVLEQFAPNSPEHGAALAVLAYISLADAGCETAAFEAERPIDVYLSEPSTNPHVQRWQVSLTYVRARLLLRRGDHAGAVADFQRVAAWDITEITPTLGTKVVDAAVRAGVLLWALGDADKARAVWRNGLSTAHRLLQCDWKEWFGNEEEPLGFAMNDAVEMVDRAAACAQALGVTRRPNSSTLAHLFQVDRQSLRAAVGRLQNDLKAAWDQLQEKAGAHDFAAQLSMTRLDRIHALEAQLSATDEALTEAQQTSIGRLSRIHELESRLSQTDKALGDVEQLSLTRLSRIHELESRLSQTDKALGDVEQLSLTRLSQIHELESRSTQTETALIDVQQLAFDRLSRVHQLESRLAETDEVLANAQQLSLDRLTQIHELESRLAQTDKALIEVQQLALERLEQSQELDNRLTQTNVALDETKTLSLERMSRIEALERQLDETNAALDELKEVSIARLAQIGELEQKVAELSHATQHHDA